MRWDAFARTVHAQPALDFVTFGANPAACRRLSHIENSFSEMLSRPSLEWAMSFCTIEELPAQAQN
jgi:hypothetical protein